jgi:hypothetical protein
MGKIITGNQGPTLGISSSKDMFEKLKYESEHLKEDWKNSYVIFNFLVTAWHLFHDWPKSEEPLNPSRIKRQKTQLPSGMLLVLDIARDLTNGSKHFTLDYKPQIEKIHDGREASYYSFFFHEDIPAVTAKTNWYFSIRVLHNILLHYFIWVFDDTIPAKNFPNEISEAILYCNIPQRPRGASPKIWLLHIESTQPKQ